MTNSFSDVEVLRGRKLLDRSWKIAVSFHLILKLLNADQLKNFFVVSVCSSTLTMNLTFSPNTKSWAQSRATAVICISSLNIGQYGRSWLPVNAYSVFSTKQFLEKITLEQVINNAQILLSSIAKTGGNGRNI
jgi:hypothetical protein